MKSLKSLIRSAVCLLACLSVLAVMTLPAAAASSTGRTIRIGYIDYGGFFTKQANGTFTGYGVQYLKEISKYTGWTYEYVYDTWPNQLENLKNGTIDFICHAQKTPQREQDYLFGRYSDGAEASVLYVRSDDERYYYEDFSRFNGMRVGLLTDSFQNAPFAEYARKNGFSYSPVYYGTNEECFAALDCGQVDAVAMGSLSGISGYKIACRFGSDPFYFMTGKMNQDLIDELDHAMGEIQSASPYFSMELFQRYYSNTDNATGLNLTREEAAYIQTAPTITVGQLRNRYPLSSVDETTGELSGINEDILGLISKMSGLKFESQPIELNEKPVAALKAGKFNMVMGILQTENFLTDPDLRLTDPFLESTMAVVMRRNGLLDISQAGTVALKSSFQGMQEYVADHYPQYHAVYYSTDEECLEAVLSGEADLMMQNVYVTNYLLQKPEYASLQILPTTFMTEQNCMAALDDMDPRLISIVNKCISVLTIEQINEVILANTTAKPYQMTSADIFYKYRTPIVIVSLLVLACLALLGSLVITRQRNLQKMEVKNGQLADAVAQAERASVAKGQFLSRMSHEIRTPMNAIVGITTIARQHEKEPERVDDYLRKIDVSSKVLLNIINDVLDMSAIESNKMKISSSEFDIKQVLTGISTIYYTQCRNKNVEFDMATDLEEEMLIGDSLRLNQILLNLVSNAYKFTDPGGKIQILVQQTARKDQTVFLRFAVSDTGCGMTREMQERLFHPFEQESAGTAQKYGGSGLGMSITKNLVELMHGAISVESEKGKGTTFTVELPFQSVEQSPSDRPESLSAIHALVVDDDQAAREYTSIVLQRIGVQYEAVDSGAAALEKIRQARDSGHPYDICFVDWKMPGMDGMEATRKIREEGQKCPLIVIVSAYDLSEAEETARKAGADMYVPKPLFQSTVFNVLMTLTDGKHKPVDSELQDYDFSGHRILLAEDNEMNSEIAMELLHIVHADVDRAENGKRALEMFAASVPGTYDMILMDVQMPVMDGYEATRQIRASGHPQAYSIPIYAMTANAFTEDISQSLSCGMNGHIAKPIDTAILYATIKRAMKN